MKLVTRIIAAILFVLFFGFALKNSHEVTLRFYLGNEWDTPLALLLLAFFAAGGVLGIIAMTPTIFRKRRALSQCRKELELLRKESQANNQDIPALPDNMRV